MMQQMNHDIVEATNPSISSLIEFSTKHYEQLVLRRIAAELKKFTAVDFKVHEFNENTTIEPGNVLLPAFENLDQIRSKLLHYHRIIRFGVGDEKIEINEIIEKLVKNLRSVIKEDKNKKLVVDSKETDLAGKLNDISASLMKIIEVKSTEVDENPKKSEQIEDKEADETKTINELRALICQACLELEKPNFTDVTKLDRLNEKYQTMLQLLNATQQKSYPKSLSIAQKEEILVF